MHASSQKILRTLPQDQAFYFYTSVDKYTGQSALSLEEFLLRIKEVNLRSLEFHLYRKDFERWTRLILGDGDLAKEIKDLRNMKPVGGTLRDSLYFLVSRHLKKLKIQ